MRFCGWCVDWGGYTSLSERGGCVAPAIEPAPYAMFIYLSFRLWFSRCSVNVFLLQKSFTRCFWTIAVQKSTFFIVGLFLLLVLNLVCKVWDLSYTVWHLNSMIFIWFARHRSAVGVVARIKVQRRWTKANLLMPGRWVSCIFTSFPYLM